MINVRFKIARQTPPDDCFWQIYELNMMPGSTILDGLNQIKWEQDGSLAFRKNCRNTICGSCAMQINGRSALACKESVGSELKRLQQIQASQPSGTLESSSMLPTITILPMGNFPVLKDLVVEMDQFWQHLGSIHPSLKTTTQPPEREFLQSPQERSRLDAVENCILCGACYADCNALEINPNFAGPHALAKAYRLIADSRDQSTTSRVHELNNANTGVWGCTRCLNCNQVCPMDVNPLDQITHIKQAILAAENDQSNRAVRHRKVLVELVKQDGWVDERQFGLKVMSNSLRDWQGLLSLGPLGLRMIVSGKFPWNFEPSTDVKTIRSLIEAIQMLEQDHDPIDAS